MKKLFRKTPPYVNQALETLGITKETGTSWFSPALKFNKEKFNEFALMLGPYYYPCFQKQFFPSDPSFKQALLPIKHCLKANGILLARRQRTENSRKTVQYYRLEDAYPSLFIVSFV